MDVLKKGFVQFYQQGTLLKLILILFSIITYFVLTLYSGGSFWEMLRFAAALLIYVILPGYLGVELLKTKTYLKEFTLPLAILMGSGFLAVLYCFTSYLNLLPLLYILPPVLGLGCFVGRKLFLQIRKGASITRPKNISLSAPQWMLLLLFAFLLLVYTFTGVVKNALPMQVGDTLLNHDLLWNAGNAFSFQLAFPPIDIRYLDVRLSYHYFTEMMAGILGMLSDVDAYRVVAFYLQPWMLGMLILCLSCFAKLLWPQKTREQLLFSYGMFLFGCASLWKILPNGLSVFWNQNITHLVTNINSQATAISVLCIFLGLFISAARRRYRIGILHFLLCLCSFSLLCVSKGPTAAIVAIALVLTVLVGLFLKQSGWQGLLLALSLGLVFLLFYFVLFSSGANNSTAFSLTGTLDVGYFANILARIYNENLYLWYLSIPLLYLLQTLLLMPAQVPLFVRGLAHDLRYFTRLSAERMLCYAAAIGGVMAYFLFSHPHMSQNYFLYTGIFFFTVLAVGNLSYLEKNKTTSKPSKAWTHRVFVGIVAFFAAVGLITAAFLYTNLVGSGARRLAFNLGFMEKYPYEVVMTADDQAGMEWLRENAATDLVFATNRIHTGSRQEGISNLYSGLSGRQGFMEGYQYAMTNMGVPESAVNERLAVNTALFSAETPAEEILRLCEIWDIDYLVYSPQMSGEESQLAFLPLVFDSPGLRIYEVAPSP